MVRLSAVLVFFTCIANAIAKEDISSSINQHHRREDQLSSVYDTPHYGNETYVAQPSEILGVNGDDPTPDYHDYLPYIYVVFSSKGFPNVRAIVEPEDDCPQPLNLQSGKDDEKLKPLYNGTEDSLGFSSSDPSKMPYRFPVKLCELVIDLSSIYLKDMMLGDMKLSHNNKTYDVPQVKADPSKFILLGDTGMRIKPKNLGLGTLGKDNTANGGFNCDGPQVYGVNQCLTNFTKEHLTETPEGSFQNLENWYFKDIADSAAKEDADVVVFVGDYLYRQGPCPPGAVNTDKVYNTSDGSTISKNEVKECSAVNDNSHMNETIQDQHMMNFVPGHYGDNWYGWWADWFYPAMNLLQTTPIIPGRGNHEICTRGGFGFFLFMFPYDIDDGLTNYCLDNYPPYAVRFEHEQFLVMDDSIINPLRGGVDHYLNTLEGCPGAPEDGQPLIVPKRENRYLDPKNAEETKDQVELFTKWFKDIEFLALDRETNFYVGHRPILGIGCNYTDVVTLDWTLQQSLGPTTFDRISALITGHMHWLEVLEFEDNVLPAQMVVGNGGTMMIENKIDQSSIPYINLTVGKEEYGIHGRVKRGITKSAFGYGIMERQDDLSYEVQFKTWQADKESMVNQFNLTIPAGLRKNAQTDATANGGEQGTMPGGNVVVSSGDSTRSRLLPFIVGTFFVVVLFN